MGNGDLDQFLGLVKAAYAPLGSLDADAPLDELEALRSIVGRSRIVGLGENWHSASELLRIKHRMIRFLVERLGFSAIVFEGSLAGAPALDRYVLGEDGDVRGALRSLGQAMWLNEETVSLIEWLRSWNAERVAESRVRVFGMDSVPSADAMSTVVSFLERVDPGFKIPAREPVDQTMAAFAAVPLDGASRAAIWGAGAAYDQLPDADRHSVLAAFTACAARLEQFRAVYTLRSSDDEFERALRCSIVVLQAWDILGARARSLRGATESRAFAFAENLGSIRRRCPANAGIIVLAHNIHVARQPFLSFDSTEPVKSMGEYLAQLFPGEYSAVCATVGSGGLSGQDAGLAGAYLSRDAVRERGDNSIDAALEKLGQDTFIASVPKRTSFAQNLQAMRSHLNPSTSYALTKAFDGIVYVDRIGQAASF